MKAIYILKCLALACLILPIFAAQAQDKSAGLKGQVLDREGIPVENITVLLKGLQKGVVTNEAGQFELRNLPEGPHVLVVRAVNIQPFERNVVLTPGQVLELQLAISESVQELQQVLVQGMRLPQSDYQKGSDGAVLLEGKKNELVMVNTLNANLVTNNTRQIFARVPGISIWENDGSGVQVGVASRGLSPNRSWEFNVRQNGYDVSSDVFGYPEAYYNPPMEAVERVQIVRGAAALQFGPQFGGLLNYVLKKGNPNKPFTFETQNSTGNNGLFSSYNSVGGQVGKLNYFGYYHHRTADGWRDNSAYLIQNGHINLRYAVSKKINIGFETSYMYYRNQQAGGLTDAQFAENARQSFRARNWFSTPWSVSALTMDYQISPKSLLSVKAFGLIAERNSIGFTQGITVMDTINALTNAYNPRQIDRDGYRNAGLEARFLGQYNMGNREHTLAAGVRLYRSNTLRRQNGTGDTGTDFNLRLASGDFRNNLQFYTNNLSVFVENIFHIGSKFTVTPGARLEVIGSEASGRLGFNADGSARRFNEQDLNRTVFLGGLGLGYQVTERTDLYANITQSFRPVLFSDLTPPATTDVIDPNLKDASGYNIDLGYRGRIKDFLQFDAGLFYLHYDNRVGTIRRAGNTPGQTFQFRTNIGTSVSQGVETFVELDLFNLAKVSPNAGNLLLFSTFAYVNAEYTRLATTSVSNGNIVEGDLKNNKVENAPEIISRSGLTYGWKNFSTTLQFSHVGEAFADASNTVTPNAAATAGLIPDYQVWDWSMTMVVKNYNFRAGINNLANERYFTRRAGGYPGPGLLPADGRNWFLSVGARF